MRYWPTSNCRQSSRYTAAVPRRHIRSIGRRPEQWTKRLDWIRASADLFIAQHRWGIVDIVTPLFNQGIVTAFEASNGAI